MFTLRFKDIMIIVIGKPINNLKIMEIVGVVEWDGFLGEVKVKSQPCV